MRGIRERIEALVGRLAQAGYRRPWPFLVAVALLAAVGLAASTRLTLRADLTELLPRSFASVRDLDTLRDRFGGLGFGVVVGQSSDPEKLREFARDMAPKLERLPGVRFVDYERPSGFFKDRALYYMELSDLEEIERRVKERERFERRKRNPLFFELVPEEPPSLDFKDIEEKYRSASFRKLSGGNGGGESAAASNGAGGSYLLDEKAGIIALMVKPMGLSSDLTYAQTFVRQLEDFLDQQDLSKYGPGFQASITGAFKKKIDQEEQIKADIAKTSTAALVLMLLFLALQFRGALPVAMDLGPVLVGLAWTYGFVALVYGEVNILTAFLGAILGGLGTEHGIHLLGRYEGLLTEGRPPEVAVREAFEHTGTSAIVSSLVAACTFASLAISEFRPFREFGVIAAVGMLTVVLSFLLTLPAMLGAAVRLGWRPRSPETVAGLHSRLATWLPRAPGAVAAIAGVVLLVLVANAPRASFTYSLAVLQDMDLATFKLDRDVNRILGYSQSPVIVLTDSDEEERAVVERLRERQKQRGEDSTIDFVAARTDLVPPDQERKQELMRSIRATLERVNPEKLSPELRERYDELMRMTATPPFDGAEIPATVRRQFEGISASEGGFVLVFPSVDTDEGSNIRALAREVRGIDLPDGRQVSASGEHLILADILDMVTREAPTILVAAVLTVLAAMWLSLGRLGLALACLAPTAISILALLGLLPLLGMRINLLNMVAIPVLIGTTVDAGVHLLRRLGEAGSDFSRVLGETGRAIGGGLLTSAIGFAAMVAADHPGLASLGELTILGFAVNAAVMLVGFPAALLAVRRLGAGRLVPRRQGAR